MPEPWLQRTMRGCAEAPHVDFRACRGRRQIQAQGFAGTLLMRTPTSSRAGTGALADVRTPKQGAHDLQVSRRTGCARSL